MADYLEVKKGSLLEFLIGKTHWHHLQKRGLKRQDSDGPRFKD
jgi:hypothetical protein